LEGRLAVAGRCVQILITRTVVLVEVVTAAEFLTVDGALERFVGIWREL
jgi:hypothetical protein